MGVDWLGTSSHPPTSISIGFRGIYMVYATFCIRRAFRYPFFLLVLLIPTALLLYANFGTHIAVGTSNRLTNVPITSSISLHSNSSILLVSAFFPLSSSRLSAQDYNAWLRRFLSQITTPIYFYAPPDLESTIRDLRGSLPIVVDTRYASAFEIPPLLGRKEDYEKMHRWDREKDVHNPEQYAVWNAKPFLLNEALNQLSPSSASQASSASEALGLTREAVKYAFWTDIFKKEHAYAAWPDVERIDAVWTEAAHHGGMEKNKEKFIFFPVQHLPHTSIQFWNENLGTINNDVSESSFFGGRPTAINWYTHLYYAYHDHFLARHIFVGNDQTLINALFLLFPSHFITVWHGDPAAPSALYTPSSPSFEESKSILGDCGEPWYYYQFFLASADERKGIVEIWNSAWNLAFWRADWWLRRRETCRLTHTLSMMEFLKKSFGEGWRSPSTGVSF